MCYPTVREHSRHDRDSTLINDHQRDRDAHNDPCAFHEITLSLNHKHRVSFPLFIVILTFPISDHLASPCLVLSRYWSSLIQIVSVIFHPHDLVIRCAAYLDEDSPSGPKVSLRHPEMQILLLDTYISTYHLCIPELHLYDHRVTVDTVKASSSDSDRIIISRSKE